MAMALTSSTSDMATYPASAGPDHGMVTVSRRSSAGPNTTAAQHPYAATDAFHNPMRMNSTMANKIDCIY